MCVGLKMMRVDSVLVICNVLWNGNEFDINGPQLKEELLDLAPLVPPKMPCLEVLNFIADQRLEECYPNVVVVLIILLTLPVTVASPERSFSKLKIIKNYLRSSMCQERLSDLSIISIERNMVEKINTNEIMDNFAQQKARKVNFK